MSESPPTIDESDRERRFEELRARTDRYVEEWDPDHADVGLTLLRIFSTFEHDVRQRLNDLPRKHHLAFLDALGFDRRPPQAARTPLRFSLSGDLDRNVRIPGGTAAVADDPDAGTVQFELSRDGGFEATPAAIEHVMAVDPARDSIVDHGRLLDGAAVSLFEGTNQQRHRFYVSHETGLQLAGGSTFTLHVRTDADRGQLFDDGIWEYYGEDDSGTTGWHRLRVPADTPGDGAVDVEALRERFASHVESAEREAGLLSQPFELPGPTVATTVGEVDSRWLRYRVPAGEPIPAIEIDEIAIEISRADADGVREPDVMLSNDVPIDPAASTIRPFGRLPQPPATCFIGCQEAFTKPGATVTLRFGEASESAAEAATERADESGAAESDPVSMGVLDGPPELSWEYWNGDGWTRLADCRDGTEAFRHAGTVEFEVPDDIEATAVSGHESVWIRARLVDGTYGRPQYDPSVETDADRVVGGPSAPAFGSVQIAYELEPQPFERFYTENNGSIRSTRPTAGEPVVPFAELPDDEQTLYVGFDHPLENGPLSLFVAIDDRIYPRSFDPGIQWEYCPDPSTMEWEKLEFDDGTDGLTERGTVEWTLATPTESFDLFGRSAHWIRARASTDAFDAGEGSTASEPPTADGNHSRSRSPPTVDTVAVNTAWAYNTVTITDEVLGSSDGSHDQSFVCSQAPIIELTLWVDEFETLSAGERRRLRERRPDDVEEAYDSRGEPEAFWVRWEAVEDFLDSGPQDRHYVVDRTQGTVQFGGGDTGRIPPRGVDNVKVSYTTGGGTDGNVDAGAVTDLKSSVSMVESVTNPLPADGGTDVESTETLVHRSSTRLKHRNRAVTATDYEALAQARFPELARVSCRPAGESGQQVTVLIVPDSEREKPVPPRALKHRVRETLLEHAPAGFVAGDESALVVSGPGYAPLSVDLTVRAAGVRSVSALKNRIESSLDDYLHPIAGNHGEGWSFQALPDLASLSAVVEGLEAVGSIVHLDGTVSVGETAYDLAESDGRPSLPEDTLVCSASHDITVRTEGA
ncbi:putative baseplate assembly protein [Halovivax limisalsi]|uniref:putative baseplate assembly protein n=1 Tax=Halovivax limisalsi TaxID=1453760 RepID=UPI001FFDB07D|nr:putative baseplate assembly protein [Halovivax limisalsi]